MAHSVGIADVLRSAANPFEFDYLSAPAGTGVMLHLRLKIGIILPANYTIQECLTPFVEKGP